MKKYSKFLLFTIGILAIAFVLDRVLGAVIQNKVLPKQENKYMYAYNGGNGEDIVIMGASRAAHHYIPQIIEDSLGVKCFNYGCDGQNIYNQYALLNLLLNNAEKKPKLVILELASIDVLNTPGYNTEKLSALHPYYSLDGSVKSVVNVQGSSIAHSLNISRLYSFNSNLHQFIKPLLGLSDSEMTIKGYAPLYAKWDKPAEVSLNEKKDEIDTLKIRFLSRFVETCKRNSINVLFINSPDYSISEADRRWKRCIMDFAQKENISFFDYERDERIVGYPELFSEPYHLNNDGASIYTKELIPIINRIINK